MTTIGKSAIAPAGATFFDSDTPLNAAACAAFRTKFDGAARYLSRSIGQAQGDLSASEARLILAAGLAIVPVQHVLAAGWMPTAAMGMEAGHAAAANAASVGCPLGTVLWFDLEGVSPDAAPEDVIDCCNEWSDAVALARYPSGVYIGASPGLSAQSLYEDLAFEHYWHSGSASAPIPVVRGVQIIQTIAGDAMAGVGYDSNTVQADKMGDLPTWWVA